MAYNFLVMLVGIVADTGMFFHLKRKEKADEEKNTHQVVPWKSGEHANDYGLKIPLNATILSSVLFLIVIILYVVFLKFTSADSDSIYLTSFATALSFVVQPPLIILLTMKNGAKVKQSPNPKPTMPEFSESDYNEQDSPEFISHEIVTVRPISPTKTVWICCVSVSLKFFDVKTVWFMREK